MMWDSNDEVPIREDKYQISVLHVDCQPEKANDTRLPRNAYIVTYMVNGVQKYDIVSGLMGDIFDCYYDKLGKGSVQSIKWTNGKVVAKLFNKKEYLKSS